MSRVKSRQIVNPPSCRPERLKSMVRTYALDPVFPQSRVVKPPFLLDRQVWKSLGKRRRKQATPRSRGRSAVTMHPHTIQPATRRVLLQNEPAEARIGELFDPPPRIPLHDVGMIGLGPDTNQANVTVSPHKLNRFTRRTHTDLNLRAHGDPFNKPTKRIGQEPIMLVPTVVTNLVTQQTR